MKLLISSCARLFKTKDGTVYTPVAYGYDFYKRYLKVFDEVCIAGFCDEVDDEKTKSMIKVSGERISFLLLPYPHGEWDYIRKRFLIKNILKKNFDSYGFDAVILRVPETLCFLIADVIKKKNIPWAVEVTSDPINLYTQFTCTSKYRLVYKYYYYYKLWRSCRNADGTAYVTQYGLQKRYPPNLKKEDSFTSFFTDTEISIDENMSLKTLPTDREIRLIHVSVSVEGFPKGHKEALEALDKLVKAGLNIEYTFVGGGEFAPSNKAFIKEAGLDKYIRRTGKITTNEVTKELERADLFCFPSYNEGLPRVVVEAMSRALPVVATDIPAHKELLPEEYLVPVRDGEALFKSVMQLVTDGDAFAKASKVNLEKAKEYDIEIIDKRRTEFYLNLKKLAEKNNNK